MRIKMFVAMLRHKHGADEEELHIIKRFGKDQEMLPSDNSLHAMKGRIIVLTFMTDAIGVDRKCPHTVVIDRPSNDKLTTQILGRVMRSECLKRFALALFITNIRAMPTFSRMLGATSARMGLLKYVDIDATVSVLPVISHQRPTLAQLTKAVQAACTMDSVTVREGEPMPAELTPVAMAALVRRVRRPGRRRRPICPSLCQ